MATLTGTSSADTIFGTTTADRITGAAGDDRLFGGAGADVILGGAGDDTIHGGAGADRITPGSNIGFDYMRAGRGADRYDFAGADAISFYELDYIAFRRGVTVNIGVSTGTVRKTDDGSVDTLVNVNRIRGDLDGGLSIIGSFGDDRITTALGAGKYVQLYGSAGDDTIIGSTASTERLRFTNFGEAVDVTVTRSVNGQMSGRAVDEWGGTDIFRNVDQIMGTRFSDIFRGSVGRDTFIPNLGADTVTGGAGVDLVRYDRSNEAFDRVVADLQTGVVRARWDGVTETDRLFGIENLRGGDGADTLRGSAVANDLRGREGGDLIEGRGGNDRLEGDGGADTLIGGLGSDRLEGESGNDRLTGGAGVDRFVFHRADGRDTVTDFQDRTDRLVIDDGATAFSQVRVADAGANVLISFASTTVTLLGVDHRLITAADFDFV